MIELSAISQGKTREGRLLGHVILGVSLYVRTLAMEKGLTHCGWLTELEHIIVSHHGETDFRSTDPASLTGCAVGALMR